MAVSDNADYFYAHTTQLLEQLHLEDVNATDIVDIIDGYKGRGYGLSTPEELGKLQRSRDTSFISVPF